MEIIDNSWKEFFEEQRNRAYFPKLEEFVNKEYDNQIVYPAKENIFNAFKYTPLDNVKVVIIGQDPYINEKQAIGIAFATGDGKVAPSLRNIYKEIKEDLGIDTSNYSCDHPIDWARQGVFLLNTTLTVRAGESNSHQGKGWSKFTDAAIEKIDRQDRSVCYLLWGNYAKKMAVGIHNPKSLILTAAHPSPLSANRGFFGCKHFSQANQFLKNNNIEPINW